MAGTGRRNHKSSRTSGRNRPRRRVFLGPFTGVKHCRAAVGDRQRLRDAALTTTGCCSGWVNGIGWPWAPPSKIGVTKVVIGKLSTDANSLDPALNSQRTNLLSAETVGRTDICNPRVTASVFGTHVCTRAVMQLPAIALHLPAIAGSKGCIGIARNSAPARFCIPDPCPRSCRSQRFDPACNGRPPFGH